MRNKKDIYICIEPMGEHISLIKDGGVFFIEKNYIGENLPIFKKILIKDEYLNTDTLQYEATIEQLSKKKDSYKLIEFINTVMLLENVEFKFQLQSIQKNYISHNQDLKRNNKRYDDAYAKHTERMEDKANNTNNNTNNDNNTNNNTNTRGRPKVQITQDDLKKDKQLEQVIQKAKTYSPGDPVDLYLKSRGIKKYHPDIKISKDWTRGEKGEWREQPIMCAFKLITEKFDDKILEKIVGTQEIYLTKDGKKYGENPKIQRTFFRYKKEGWEKDEYYHFQPVRLKATGENNGIIYVCEGVETGLSIQEVCNNEVWCSLSRVNYGNLPYDKRKIYVFVFDNDLNKKGDGVKKGGEDFLKEDIELLTEKKDMRFFYVLPSTPGTDANDELQAGTLDKLISGGYKLIPTKKYFYIKKRSRNLDTGEFETIIEPVEIQRPILKGADAPPDGTERLTFDIPISKYGILQRFILKYKDKYKFVSEKNRFLVYHEGKYHELLKKEAKASVEMDIYKVVYGIINEFDYYTEQSQYREFNKFWKDGRGPGNFPAHEVEKILRSHTDIATLSEYFDDKDEHYLNFKNCLLNLKTQKIVKHSPNILSLNQIEYEYRPDIYNILKGSMVWDKFISDIFDGNQETIEFLQKCLGYTLTNQVKEHKIFILKGAARSGKTLLLRILNKIMGDYGTYSTSRLITSKDEDNNLLDKLADTKGKRFMHLSEIPFNVKVNSNTLKNISGDGFISASKKFESNIVFESQMKIWISTNNLRFDSYEEAIKERIVMFDFKNRYYDAGTQEAIETGRVKDYDLEDKLTTKDSIEYIINWMIDGYKKYKKDGLTIPDSIKQNYVENELQEDRVAPFIQEYLVRYNELKEHVEFKKSADEVYDVYKKWEMETYKLSESETTGKIAFYKRLRSKGIIIARTQTNGLRRQFLQGYHLVTEQVTNLCVYPPG